MAANFDERLCFTPVELEKLFPFRRESWQRWARNGRVRAHSIGRRILISKSEVDRILREEVRDAQPELAAQP
jgi:excisionase family DNA binding protein